MKPAGCDATIQAAGCWQATTHHSRAAAHVPPLPSPPPRRQGSSNGNGAAADDSCRVFVDRDGEMIRVMCCDYGALYGRPAPQQLQLQPQRLAVLAPSSA